VQTARATSNLTKTTFLQVLCVTKITKGDMAVLLKDANAVQLELLSKDPEGKKKVAENLSQLLAVACQGRKEGIANDPNTKRELENIRMLLTATIYDQKKNSGKSPGQPFRNITKEQVDKFWNNKSHEADFQEFLVSKLAMARENGNVPKDKELTEDEIKLAKDNYAKIAIYEAEEQAKASELGEDFKHELELQIKLQQAQFLAGVYARRVLVEKTKVTDEEIQLYTAKHPEFDTKVQKGKAYKILQRAKAGENFAALAKSFSEDPTTNSVGGLYKGIIAGQFLIEIERVALSLNSGQIYPELVETSLGYHIIKLEKKGEVKDQSGKMKASYDVRQILISTLIKDPNNPTSVPIAVKEYVREKIQTEKEKKILDKILANNPVEIENF
jgi:parvulin-like peptidyl-prolyl isomerase